ncbi:MAG: hypothetical protein NE327_17640 [Lentisphaeraceae bacterium]|nr:hypothetical protein [Lentisphaeraceae bacterium]
MTLDQERKIHRLLLQREREFTAVWRAECEINKILGADFPFAEPPDLPSSYKPVKKKSAKLKKPKIPKLNSIIRNLSEDENAYRVVYSAEGKEHASFQTDTALLRKLVPLKTNNFYICSIETVKLASLEKYSTVESLWQEGDEFIE